MSVVDKPGYAITLPPLNEIAFLMAEYQGRAEGYEYALRLMKMFNGYKHSCKVVAHFLTDAIRATARRRDAHPKKSLQWHQENSELRVYKDLLTVWDRMEQKAAKEAHHSE